MSSSKNLFIIVLSLSLFACKKKDKPLYVRTFPKELTTIQSTSVSSGGVITGENVTEKGVCWGTEPNPDINGSKTSDGGGEQRYESKITGLIPLRTYYLRAYAINGAGIVYGDEVNITTTAPTSGELVDYDGNHYNTITIGSQNWMAENLRVTRYRNGDLIQYLTDNTQWVQYLSGAFCYYNNNNSNLQAYGLLYNWYAVNDSRNIAPQGWHVPTKTEWEQLLTFLGSNNIAGNKMRLSQYWPANPSNTNESGFSALPGGYRNSGTYNSEGNMAYFWTATMLNQGYAATYCLDYQYLYTNSGVFSQGMSVRLIHD